MPYTVTYQGDDTRHLAAALSEMVDLVARFGFYYPETGATSSGDYVIKRATNAHVWLQPWSDALSDEDPRAPQRFVRIDRITDVHVY